MSQPNLSIELDEYQIQFLLEHLGYGGGITSPEKVQILFIGNESGTANRTVSDYIDRLTYPDKYVNEKNENSTNEVSSLQKHPRMLQFMNRIKLYSFDQNPKWLLPKSQLNLINPEDYKRVVNESWNEGGIIHLFDIRPLPRPTEKSPWPYNKKIDESLYLDAFKKFKIENNNPYSKWVEYRNSLLQQKIEEFKSLKCIIAAGDPNMKMKFIKGVFPDLQFVKVEGQSKHSFQIAVHNTQERQFKVIICNFLSSYVLGFDGLSDLASFAFQP